jgi:hypothetical protein
LKQASFEDLLKAYTKQSFGEFTFEFQVLIYAITGNVLVLYKSVAEKLIYRYFCMTDHFVLRGVKDVPARKDLVFAFRYAG